MVSRKPDLRLVPAPAPSDERRKSMPDDGQLVAAIRAGDPAAAGALYDRMRPVIDRTLSRLLGAADSDHPDLAQQAMITVIQTIDRYRGECSLDGWASTITAHIVYKHIRQRRIERRIFAGHLEAAAVDHAPSAIALGATIAMRVLLGRIAVHLSAMDPGRAFAVVLHDVHGYDLKEIASITSVSVSAAQTRLSRGRRELHDRIAADPGLADALESTGGGES